FAAWQWTALAGALNALSRHGQALAQWDDGRLVQPIKQMLEEARRIAVDPRTSEPDRVAAVHLLGPDSAGRDAAVSVLAKLLVPQNPVSLQAAVADGLGRLPDRRAAATLIAGWKAYTPTLKSQVLDLLLSRDGWERQLLESIDKRDVPAAQIDAKH